MFQSLDIQQEAFDQFQQMKQSNYYSGYKSNLRRQIIWQLFGEKQIDQSLNQQRTYIMLDKDVQYKQSNEKEVQVEKKLNQIQFEQQLIKTNIIQINQGDILNNQDKLYLGNNEVEQKLLQIDQSQQNQIIFVFKNIIFQLIDSIQSLKIDNNETSKQDNQKQIQQLFQNILKAQKEIINMQVLENLYINDQKFNNLEQIQYQIKDNIQLVTRVQGFLLNLTAQQNFINQTQVFQRFIQTLHKFQSMVNDLKESSSTINKELQGIQERLETNNSILNKIFTKQDQVSQFSQSRSIENEVILGLISYIKENICFQFKGLSQTQSFFQSVQSLYDFFHHKCHFGIIKQLKELISQVKLNNQNIQSSFMVQETLNNVNQFIQDLNQKLVKEDIITKQIQKLYYLISQQQEQESFIFLNQEDLKLNTKAQVSNINHSEILQSIKAQLNEIQNNYFQASKNQNQEEERNEQWIKQLKDIYLKNKNKSIIQIKTSLRKINKHVQEIKSNIKNK